MTKTKASSSKSKASKKKKPIKKRVTFKRKKKVVKSKKKKAQEAPTKRARGTYPKLYASRIYGEVGFVDEKSLANTKVWEKIKVQGWEKLLSTNFEVRPHMVIEFYKKSRVDYTPSLLFQRFRLPPLTNLWFNKEDGLEVLGLPTISDEDLAFRDYDLKTWPTSLEEIGITCLKDCLKDLETRPQEKNIERVSDDVDLKYLNGDDKLLLHIVSTLVLPCHSKDSLGKKLQSVLTCMIKHEIKIDFLSLMARHIEENWERSKSQLLPYGGFICAIMKHWRKSGDGNSRPLLLTKIGEKTYKDQGSILFGSRLLQDWEVDTLTPSEKLAYDDLVGTKDGLTFETHHTLSNVVNTLRKQHESQERGKELMETQEQELEEMESIFDKIAEAVEARVQI